MPLWTRRQTLRLFTGAVSGLVLHACTQSQQTSSSEESLSTSLGIVTWIGYTPLYIAQEKGFFKEVGLDLDVKVFNSGTEAIAAFTGGRVNGLSLVPSEAVTLAANGKDYRVIFVQDTSAGADGILARNTVSSIQEFKGKEIAVEKGGVSHFFLLQALSEAGLQERDVKLFNVTPDAAAAAYQAGKVEIAVTYAPFLYTANTAQKDGKIIYDSSKLTIPTAIADLYIFDTQTVETKPKALEALVRGLIQGLNFLQTNKQEGLEIAAKRLQLKPEELAEQLKGVMLPDLVTNIEMLSKPESNLYVLKAMQPLAEFLQAQGKIQQVPDLSQVLEPKIVLAVQGNA